MTGRFRANSDGTVDWCGLTGWDLAAVFRACAGYPKLLSDEQVEQVAAEAVGGCLAVWETEGGRPCTSVSERSS